MSFSHKELQQLYLHDAEIGLISVNYKEQSATVRLKYPGFYDATLLFTQVKHVNIPINEPWGGGIYVSDVKVHNQGSKTKSPSTFETVILLNSGDEIRITASELSVEGYNNPPRS